MFQGHALMSLLWIDSARSIVLTDRDRCEGDDPTYPVQTLPDAIKKMLPRQTIVFHIVEPGVVAKIRCRQEQKPRQPGPEPMRETRFQRRSARPVTTLAPDTPEKTLSSVIAFVCSATRLVYLVDLNSRESVSLAGAKRTT